jgi:hypothetical protein
MQISLARQLAGLASALMVATLVYEQTDAAPSIHWVNDDAAAYTAPGISCAVAGHATIQAAVDAASSGDSIRVCPGTYNENVAINTNDLQVLSTDGAALTVVNAAVSFHVFQIRGRDVTIEGLTVVPAGFHDGDIGVNLAVDGASPANFVLLKNVVIGGRIGVNLGCASFGSTVAHNTISGQTEAGINIDTCEIEPFPGSHDNSVHHNTVCSVTSTGSIALGGSSDSNSIHHNVATSILVYGAHNTVHHNTTQVAITDSSSSNNLHNNSIDPRICSRIP